jgi:WD40 repeat protein
VVAVALSEDGSRVVSAGRDGLLRVWDRSGKVVTECGHAGGPPWLDADISRDGRRVVAIRESEDGTSPDLLLTETGAGCKLTRLSGHFGNVGSAAFDESGEWVLSYGNNDNTARIWAAAEGRLSATLTHPDEVFGASFSPDGSEVAVAVSDGTVYRWTARGRLIGHPLSSRFTRSAAGVGHIGPLRTGWPACGGHQFRWRGICLGRPARRAASGRTPQALPGMHAGVLWQPTSVPTGGVSCRLAGMTRCGFGMSLSPSGRANSGVMVRR